VTRHSFGLALASSLFLFACGGSAPAQGGTTTASHDCGCPHEEGTECPCHHGEGHADCQGACAHHEHGATASSATVVPPGEAHVGDTTTCPISGEQFVVTESSPHAEYEGHTYYFCCPGCAGRFEANPAQYAHPASSGGEASATPTQS
jgi:YHS domain-containing protein